MKRAIWLAAFWPLVFLPFLSDPTPSGARGATVEADTTYSDDRFVGLVPGVWNIVVGESLFVPDPDSVGAGVAYRATRVGDSFLVISYDTLVVAALDSAVVDSIWAANSIGTPYAYSVTVPDGTGLAYGDLGTIFELTVEDSGALASLVGYAYLDTMPFKNYPNIVEYDSLFENWSDYWWADWVGDSAAMAAWNTGLANTIVDSAGSCYYILNYHNYYDRTYSHLSYWWRTGDTSYVRKANGYADKYQYCLLDAYRAPRDFIPDGLVMRWIMSEDTMDLKALTRETAYLEQFFARREFWGAATECEACDDARVQARTYTSIVLARQFDYPDTAAWSPGWDSAYTYAADSMWQWVHVGSDSAYQSGFFPLYSYCNSMIGWQMGTQFSHAMIRDQEFLATPARSDSIDSLIVRLADTLWTLGWVGVDPVGKAHLDSFNFLYSVGLDTTDERVMLKHSNADSTAAWWWRSGRDPDSAKAPTASIATDSFWQFHIYYRDTNNGGHDSVPEYTRAIDLNCHGDPPINAHSVWTGHVTQGYQPDALLTGMIAPIYARAWRITGDSVYWHMADSLLQGVIYGGRVERSAWMYSNGKLYNEAYYQMQRAIKWLDEGP